MEVHSLYEAYNWGKIEAVRYLLENGADVKTEYDKPDDPASKDATVMIVVADPFAEPRIQFATRPF